MGAILELRCRFCAFLNFMCQVTALEYIHNHWDSGYMLIYIRGWTGHYLNKEMYSSPWDYPPNLSLDLSHEIDFKSSVSLSYRSCSKNKIQALIVFCSIPALYSYRNLRKSFFPGCGPLHQKTFLLTFTAFYIIWWPSLEYQARLVWWLLNLDCSTSLFSQWLLKQLHVNYYINLLFPPNTDSLESSSVWL